MRLKVELHSHTSDDPIDLIRYSAYALIDRAVALGYHALAITLHEKQLDPGPLHDYASARGLLLIPGIEQTIEGRHVLLINFTARAETVTTFEALRQLREDEPGLVIAPHPYYPLGSCLGDDLDRHAAVFDAVEINSAVARGADFNRAAVRWARQHGKPLVGNGDVHRLSQLGRTYSIVDADLNARAICDAIRAGRVDVHSAPLSWFRTIVLLADILSTAFTARIFRLRRPARRKVSLRNPV